MAPRRVTEPWRSRTPWVWRANGSRSLSRCSVARVAGYCNHCTYCRPGGVSCKRETMQRLGALAANGGGVAHIIFWVPIRQNLRGARRFSSAESWRWRNRFPTKGLRRTRVVFICSYLAGHWDLTRGWIGGGFAALSNLALFYCVTCYGSWSWSKHPGWPTSKVIWPTWMVCLRLHGHGGHRWPPLSPIRITVFGKSDSNRRF